MLSLSRQERRRDKSLADTVCGSKLCKHSSGVPVSAHSKLESAWSLHPLRRWALLLLHCLLSSFITGGTAVSKPKYRDIQICNQTLHLSFKQQAISVADSLVAKARTTRDTMVSRREVKSTEHIGSSERSRNNCFQIGSKRCFADGKPQAHYQMYQLPKQQ